MRTHALSVQEAGDRGERVVQQANLELYKTNLMGSFSGGWGRMSEDTQPI